MKPEEKRGSGSVKPEELQEKQKNDAFEGALEDEEAALAAGGFVDAWPFYDPTQGQNENVGKTVLC